MISDGIENCVQYIHNFNLRNPRILLLTLRRLYIMHFSAEYKERKDNLKLKIKS